MEERNEKSDDRYIVKGMDEEVNKINCAVCNLILRTGEVKFLLSSTELLELNLPLEKRQVCIDCYSTMNNDVPRIKRYKQRLNLYKEINLK